MKNIFSIVLMVCVVNTSEAQNQPNGATMPPSDPTVTPVVLPSNYTYTSGKLNFVRTFIPQVPVTSVTDTIFNLSPGSTTSYTATVQTTYTNGWGKTLETIKRGAPRMGEVTSADIIMPVDNRPSLTSNSFLPYSTSVGSQFQAAPFTDQQTYYSGTFPNEGSTSYSQGITSFDPSNTPTTQSYAPGSSFVGQGNGVTTTMTIDDGSAGIPIYAYVGGALTNEGTYATGALTIKTTTDAAGAVTIQYFDNSKRLVCKTAYAGAIAPTMWLTTYYVYDDLGRLIYMIPPKAVATGDIADAIPALGYTYSYNDHGQVVTSNTPGMSDAVATVYDFRHLPVLTQTPLQQTEGVWTFYLYDIRDRLAISGTTTIPGGPSVSTAVGAEEWQTAINTDIFATEDPDVLGNFLVFGAPPVYPPSIIDCQYDVLNYYDKYPASTPDAFKFPFSSFSGFDTSFSADYLAGVNMVKPVPYLLTQGMLTATQVRVKDPSDSALWVNREYFYDQKGHTIQVQTIYPWNQVKPDVITLQYNFAGQLVQQINKHYDTTTSNKQVTTVATVYNYDIYHDGRLLSVQQRIDTGAWRYLSAYQYDSLGRVKQKMLGGVEEQDYAYNIRGQLQSINADYAQTTPESVLDKTFGEVLGYDYGFTTPSYDGSVSGYVWRGGGSTSPLRSYGYAYDSLKRLTAANFLQYTATEPTWANDIADYTMDGATYDEGGNITAMHQRGTTTKPVELDQLTYTYADGTNQLAGVADAVTTNYNKGDFNNSTCTDCTQYTYDADGNLTADVNKNITAITYSDLDKPVTITFANGSTINNIYDAQGMLLKRILVDSVANTTVIRYWGPFVYQNDSLQYVLNEEGRARWKADSNTFHYDYFVKDHTGSVRSMVTANAEPTLTYFASHELAEANVEESMFSNIDNVRDHKIASTDSADDMAARLNGNDTTRRIGTAIFMETMAGDQFDISAQSFWADTAENGYETYGPMMGSILSVLTGGIDGTLESESATESVLSNTFTDANYSAYEMMLDTLANPNVPRAFINYVVFDEDMNLVASASGAIQVGAQAGSWQTVQTTSPVVAPVNGYIAIYMSDEQLQDVFMDNMSITCYKSKLLQERHYYPFGLPVDDGENTHVLANKYLFQGNENQDSFGLNLADFHARQYDYQLGRFTGIDPLAGQYGQEVLSPYHFCSNNPANFVDPMGMYGGKDGRGIYTIATENYINNDFYGSFTYWLIQAYEWSLNNTTPEPGDGPPSGNATGSPTQTAMSTVSVPGAPGNVSNLLINKNT